jgi:hypothetical protein
MLWIQWAKVEQQRCLWYRFNQETLRADTYGSLLLASQEAAANSSSSSRAVGRRTILPSSHVGGPRFMTQLYFCQDASWC